MAALAGIIILGIFAQWIAWRAKVPAILPLILIGLAVGPLATLYTADGCKLIQPMSEGGDLWLLVSREKFCFILFRLQLG